MRNTTLTEQWRDAADKWVDADDAARMLEDTKSAMLAKWMAELGDVPVSRAEQSVKASVRWKTFVESTVKARTVAEKLKIEMKYLEMRRMDERSEEATHRVEARL